MTGADLANLVNEAALLAARRNQDAVQQRDLTAALEKVQLGTARNVVIPEAERRRTAYHEAGHALLGMLPPGADPVRKVSIIPRGRALGVTLSTPDSDRYGYDANSCRLRTSFEDPLNARAIDRAGQDRVCPNSVVTELNRERLRETDDAPLGGRVRTPVRVAESSGDRRHVDGPPPVTV
jgi:hypothetical protein